MIGSRTVNSETNRFPLAFPTEQGASFSFFSLSELEMESLRGVSAFSFCL